MTDIAARNKRNRAKGSRFQSELRDGLRGEGLDTERLALTGKDDEGDHVVRLDGGYVVIEAKNAAMDPAGFVSQAQVEAANFAKHRGLDASKVKGIAVIKRRGKGFKDAYVLTTVREYFGLDES